MVCWTDIKKMSIPIADGKTKITWVDERASRPYIEDMDAFDQAMTGQTAVERKIPIIEHKEEPVIQQNPVAETGQNDEYNELYNAINEAGLKVFKIEGKVIVAANEWKARRQYRKKAGKIICMEV